MRSSELHQLMQFLVVRPLLTIGRLIRRYKVFSSIWGIWAYVSMLAVGLTTGSVTVWLLSALIPGVAVIINAPILWMRNRDSRKERRRRRLREDITRMERELELV